MRLLIVTGLSLLAASWTARADWESYILPGGFVHASSLDKALALAKEKNKALILYYTREPRGT